MNDTNICPICYENIYQKDTHLQPCCNHKFHIECLMFWFLGKRNKKESLICPMCRTQNCFNLNEHTEKFLKTPITRSKYKLFEKIYTSEVKTLLNKCDLLKVAECKTQVVIKIMNRVFENPLLLVKNKNFNKTVKERIEFLTKELVKIRKKINKETYYNATYILEECGDIYNMYLVNFK